MAQKRITKSYDHRREKTRRYAGMVMCVVSFFVVKMCLEMCSEVEKYSWIRGGIRV